MMQVVNNKPWHTYPLVWMMIAIPFSAVIMGVVMLWLAIDTDDGLVVDDYYKQGLEINKILERTGEAEKLKIAANINLADDHKTIKLTFNKGMLATSPETLKLNVQHATHAASDMLVTLNKGMGNQYIGYLSHPINVGVWYFVLTDANWKLSARALPNETSSISLGAK